MIGIKLVCYRVASKNLPTFFDALQDPPAPVSSGSCAQGSRNCASSGFLSNAAFPISSSARCASSKSARHLLWNALGIRQDLYLHRSSNGSR